MTTSNEILAYTYQDVLHIPIEALQNDTIAYVFKIQNGTTVKQEVISGETNDNEVIIEHGLAAGEEILLTPPDSPGKLKVVPLDPKIKVAIKKKMEAEKKKRQEEALEKMKRVKDDYQPKNEDSGGGFIIFG